MDKFSKGQASAFLFSLFILLDFFPSIIAAQVSTEVYVYSFLESPSLERIKSYFINKSDLVITIYDLNNESYSDELLKIVKILAMQGIQFLPPKTCITCELSHFTWKEIYLRYSRPLILFFRNKRLRAITIASSNHDTLDQALVSSGEHVKVFMRDGTVTSIDEEARSQIELLFNERHAKPYVEVFHLLPLIIMTASVDAINPCEFYVLIIFLSFVAFRIGKKATLKAGVAYSVAVFIIYFLMGLGISKLIAYAQEAKIFVAILGFSLGIRSFLNFVFGVFGLSLGLRDTIEAFSNRKFKRVPDFFSKRLYYRLRRVSKSPVTAFAIGVVASAFLLPCTSGPYLIALSLIADLETQLQGLLLLAIYNSIIIAPFLVITVGIYTLKLKTGELKRWSSTKQKWLNLIGGLLMIVLSLYLVLTI